MGYVYFNPNPKGKMVGDCAVRAISRALGESWEAAYMRLIVLGMQDSDMPTANSVWGKALHRSGFDKCLLAKNCSDCYTLEDFCRDNPLGLYVVATSGHVVTVVDGDIYDSWDSSAETPIYYWQRKED